MTRDPVAIPPETLAVEALNIMEQRKITSIVVVEAGHGPRRWRRAPPRSVADGDVLTADPCPFEAKAARIRLLLFDVDGVLTDGKVLAARRRHREQALRHPRRHRHRVGAAGRAQGRACCRRATSATTTHRAAQLGVTIVHQGVLEASSRRYERICRRRRGHRRGSGVHGRRHRRPRRARPGGLVGGAGRRRRRGAAAAWTGSAARTGGEGAARELIEVILRAQGRWDGVVAAYAGGGPAAHERLLRAAAGGARRASRRPRRSARPGSATS